MSECLLPSLVASILLGAPANSTTVVWSQITADEATVGRAGPCLAFDTRRQQFMAVGGAVYMICPPGGYLIYPSSLLTHHLDANVPWSSAPTSGGPNSYLGSASYDPVTDRLWLFGGEYIPDGVHASWTKAVGALDPVSGIWQMYPASGAFPPFMTYPEMALDPAQRRLLLLGGRDSTGTPVGGVYAMPLATPGVWSLLSPAGSAPSPRFGACTIFDPDSDRVWVIAGTGASGQPLQDVWTLQLGGSPAWKAIPTSGTAPRGRAWGALDRASHRLIVLAGDTLTARSLDPVTHAWAVLAASGTVPDPTVNGRFFEAGAAFDPVSRRLALAWPEVFPVYCDGLAGGYTEVMQLLPDTVTAVPDESALARFRVGLARPVPARDWLELPITLLDNTPCSVAAFDLAGRRLWSAGVEGTGEHVVRIDTRRFGAAVGWIRVDDGTHVVTRRIAVLH